MTQTDLNTLVEEWRKVRQQRLELDDLSKKLKAGPEAELRARILMWLDSNNLPGAKTQHGTVSRTRKNHLEVTDTETFLRYMYDGMTQCINEGRPLADGLLVQKVPLKSGITEHVHERLGISDKDSTDDETFNSIANVFGITRVSVDDIAFKS